MCQPKKWWWGLLPLALLFALMIGMSAGPIEGDLAKRSSEEFARSGLPWAKSALSGRDAVVTGEAPTPESQKLAVSAAERAWGVRRVADSTTVSPEIKPFTASATRDAAKITLTGFVSSDAARAAVEAATKAAFPNVPIDNQLKFGRGAPAGYVAGLTHGLTQLGKLTSGTVSLSDSAYTIVGQAPDLAAFDGVTAAVKQLPAGLTLAKAEIAAPAVTPYLFSATKSADGLALGGHLPTEAARAAVLTAAKSAGAQKIADGLRVAAGLPASVDFGKASEFIFAQLGALKTGAATLRGDALTISGQTDDVAAFQSVTAALGGTLPAGMKLASQDIKGPAPVSPYAWSAARAASGLTLTGSVPSESARGSILDQVKQMFPATPIVDQMKLALGAPNGFANAVNVALSQLSRLATGSATINNTTIRVTGEAPDKSVADQIRAALASAGLPTGFSGLTDVTFSAPPAPPAPAPAPAPAPVAPAAPVAQPARELTPAEICQVKFREILAKDQIHFATASARITAESQAVLKLLADAVRACPTMTVEIQGHTDADGTDETNLDLSNRRAAAVVEALENMDVEKGRMTSKGFGRSQPIAPNDTPEGKAKNRRIEFTVTK